MMLLTRNRKFLALVQAALRVARPSPDQDLVVWNTRVRTLGRTVVLESACPIYLEKIVDQLKILVGEKPGRGFVWFVVRGRTDPASPRPGSRRVQAPRPAGGNACPPSPTHDPSGYDGPETAPRPSDRSS